MKTSTFTVNNLGDPEPVIATIRCHEIVIGELNILDGNWPTTQYKVKGNEPGSELFVKEAGTTYTFKQHMTDFTKPFEPGDIAGYVETVSGSVTFFMEEHQ